MTSAEASMSGSGWSCPHELAGRCGKVNEQPCDPGMKGCELYGRYSFFDGSKNERFKQKQARAPLAVGDGAPNAGQTEP
jgi:hypothetical protein